MKIEDQVVSLELAKQLKSLGVKQSSVFKWIDYGQYANHLPEVVFSEVNVKTICTYYSAFSVAELGEMLPKEDDKTFQYIEIKKDDDINNPWSVGYRCPIPQITDMYFHCKTEADARAKMLVWLIENKYLSIEG